MSRCNHEDFSPEEHAAYREVAMRLLDTAIEYLVCIVNEWEEDGYQEIIEYVTKQRDGQYEIDDGSGKAFRDKAWTDEERAVYDAEYEATYGAIP